MGSPWPWTHEATRSTNGASINNNNNNIKRANYYDSYSPFYNNQHNQGFHHHYMQNQQHNNTNRYNSSTPQSPAVGVTPTSGDLTSSGGGGVVMGKRPHLQNNGYYNYDGGYQSQQQVSPTSQTQNHLIRKSTSNNNNGSSMPSSTTPSSTPQQSQFVTFVKEIPTWNIYYSDQKHRIVDFTDKNNSIRHDPDINQHVSLCFDRMEELAVDVLVNSTNESYSGVTGVDKIIHQKAGRGLREACKTLPRLAPGQAEMTQGFSLPAKYIIHTNGPLTEDAEQLTGCYVNSLNLLLMHRLRTIAFPCISTGKKGLSKKFAAEIALRTVRQFLEEHKEKGCRIIFCLHNQRDVDIYLRYMQIYFPVAVDPDFRAVGSGRWDSYLRIDRDN